MRPPGAGLALYVHLPWCVRKCPYCDFNSHQMKSPRPDRAYIDSLLVDFDAELPLVADRRIETVFFGGGTPSLFPPEDFAYFLRAIRERIAFAHDAEITLEANPGTIERGHFRGYREAGINRVSLGAQSFDAGALQRLGRIHTADDTHRAVDELRAGGIANFNLDLMYALPGQSLEEAMLDVRTASELRPPHLSYYQLTLEPGTVFHARPPDALPDDEAAWIIQTEAQARLGQEGYAQYEVSAYSLPGFECRHNLNYWLFGDYLGIGAGAHGKLSVATPERILRTAKPKLPREFSALLASPAPIGDRRFVPMGDLPFEFMLNALRLNRGFTKECFEARTGLPCSVFAAPMRNAADRRLIIATDTHWIPTDLGRRFLNDLQSGFLP
ncbi:MAG: radical SAM family heme chaperone HemW [Steroidobacteraceae bacterium]